jgi:thiol-disulfide isomerase/thioredoxin
MRVLSSLSRSTAAILLCALVKTASAAPGAGDTPPDFVGQTWNDTPVLLSQYAGKTVVMSFWATWCGYCMKELPILANIQKAAKGKVQVIAVNTEERDVFDEVRRPIGKMELVAAYDPEGKAQKAFGVNGIPHMVIIGRDGKIVEVFRGYDASTLPTIVAAINRAMGATQPSVAAQ